MNLKYLEKVYRTPSYRNTVTPRSAIIPEIRSPTQDSISLIRCLFFCASRLYTEHLCPPFTSYVREQRGGVPSERSLPLRRSDPRCLPSPGRLSSSGVRSASGLSRGSSSIVVLVYLVVVRFPLVVLVVLVALLLLVAISSIRRPQRV